jgi:hypothetical protein
MSAVWEFSVSKLVARCPPPLPQRHGPVNGGKGCVQSLTAPPFSAHALWDCICPGALSGGGRGSGMVVSCLAFLPSQYTGKVGEAFCSVASRSPHVLPPHVFPLRVWLSL